MPATATLVSGQGSKRVVVSFANVTAFNQRLGVFATNGCGNSTMLSSGNININPSFCGRVAAVNMLTEESQLIEIYPNPANFSTNVVFNSENESNYELNIIDLAGRKVASSIGKSFEGTNKVKVDLTQFASGLYHVQVIINGNIERGRLIVQ